MIFNKKQLDKMKQRIEQKTSLKWDKAIIQLADRSNGSGFSEFETYAISFPPQKKQTFFTMEGACFN